MELFVGLIAFYLGLTIFCVFSFERAMWLCIDYWTKKQYRLWKIICAAIGLVYLLIINLFFLFSSNKSSDNTNRIVFLLVISAYFTMSLFTQLIHFIAWNKKKKILQSNIRNSIVRETQKKESMFSDKNKLLQICLYENRMNYSPKQIERVFYNIIDEIHIDLQ